MKKLLIAFLLLITNSADAQYQSFFGAVSTSWNVRDYAIMDERTDSMVVVADTIIQAQSYKIMHWHVEATHARTSYLREDTTMGRLWYLEHPDSAEVLAVDMSLNIGDVFTVPAWIPQYSTDYIADSVYYQSGRKVIRLTTQSQFPQRLTFFEGIGTDKGVAYIEYDFAVLDPYLLCQYKDGVKTYSNPFYNGACQVWGPSGIEEQKPAEVKVYPNPFTNYLTLKLPYQPQSPTEVTLYNLQGQKIYASQPNSNGSEEIKLALPAMPAGLYFLRVSSQKQSYTVKVQRE